MAIPEPPPARDPEEIAGGFETEGDVYRRLGAVLRALADEGILGSELATAGTSMRWRYSDPEATISARLADGRVLIETGETGGTGKGDAATVAMSAATGHRFWLGRVDLGAALLRGQIRVSGPLRGILGLVALIEPAAAIYERQLIDAGPTETAPR